MIGYGTFGTVMDVLESELAKTDYAAGSRFTAADVYLGAHIGWGFQFGTIEKRASLVDYFARLEGRPARQRAEELDNALLGSDS